MSIRRSIRLRLTFVYIGSISLLVLLFGVIIFLILRAMLLRDIDEDLHSGATRLEAVWAHYQDDAEFAESLNEATADIFVRHLAYVQMMSHADQPVPAVHMLAKTATLKEHTLPLSEPASQAIQTGDRFVETVSGVFHFPLRVITFSVYDKNRQPYIVQIGLSLYDIQKELSDLLRIFAVSFPVLLVVVSILGYMFMKRAFSPVKRMVAVTRRITAEDLSLRLEPLHSHDEIGELANTLNEMISRLEESFHQIQQFSADVSHELKTPLAKLKCHAEVTLRRERSGEEYQRVLRKMIEDMEKLQQIIENLFLLVRMDARQIPHSFLPFALHDVFFTVFEELQPLAAKKHVGIEFEEIPPLTIEGDQGLLKRVFTNLLLNAIQYTPSGGTIIVSLRQEADNAVLTMADTGIGIPKEALPHIFDRFYRADPSRSYETGGSGLGLAIARKSVEFHGGSISVQSEEGQGTTCRVSLPCS